ncbi:hypothetical protein D3C75_1147340 [compost metagenome]
MLTEVCLNGQGVVLMPQDGKARFLQQQGPALLTGRSCKQLCRCNQAVPVHQRLQPAPLFRSKHIAVAVGQYRQQLPVSVYG